MSEISPTLIEPSDAALHFEDMTSDLEEPFDAEFSILAAVYLAAQAQAQKVVLDGAGGDVVLGEGTYIVRLLRKGHVRKALAEIAGERGFWGGPSWPAAILGYAKSAYLPEVIKRPLRPLRERKAIAGYLRESLVRSDFAKRVDIHNRFARMGRLSADGWQADFAEERSSAIRRNMTAGRERYARIAARQGVEARDPFMDKRVIDYCSQLPGHLRMRHGWAKVILRDVMAGRLPHSTLRCRGKPHIGWLFNSTVTQEAAARGQLEARELASQLQDYVNEEALQRAWSGFADGSYIDPLHAAHGLSVWLRQTENRPVVPD
jgi:asparagine synthase (glutamine-hydrolysing)